MHTQKTYEQIQHLIAPGDIIAFGGRSLFSRWTKFTTGAVVTHTAMVISPPDDASSPELAHSPTMIEATSIKGKKGVMRSYLTERIKQYRGEVWWLPLHASAKQQLSNNWQAFHDFLHDQLGKPYDIWQLFGAAIDVFDDHPRFHWLTYNQTKLNRWFCSELVAEGLRQAGIIDTLNPSETTPKDVCEFSIFAAEYVQMKGKKRIIKGFNSVEPNGWGMQEIR